MSKFKAGGKVKVVRTIGMDEVEGIHVGDTLSIIQDDRDGFVRCSMSSGEEHPMMYEQIELVKEDKMSEMKFKVGDKVRVVSSHNTFCDIHVGDEGKIDEVNTGIKWYYIDFGNGKRQNLPFIFSDSVELVIEKSKPKTELRIVYKVTGDYGNRGTISWNVTDPEYIRDYKLNVQVKPKKGTYLYAFDSIESAQESIVFSDRIVKCIAKVVLGINPKRSETKDNYQEFWADPTNLKWANAPKGTVWCKWVFPIEEVA
jgi:hypothetical protein